jgi:hypothetical protein
MAEGCGNEEVSMALEEIAERHRAHLTADDGQFDTVSTVH